jgi:hypothetical protein
MEIGANIRKTEMINGPVVTVLGWTSEREREDEEETSRKKKRKEKKKVKMKSKKYYFNDIWKS